MSDGDGQLIFFGFVLGAFISAIVMFAWTNSATNDSWKVEAVAHGYAHYELDHSFHWNNEPKEK